MDGKKEMTDDEIIKQTAIALCCEYSDGAVCAEAPCGICVKEARAALAVARPIIRAQALEEAAETARRECTLEAMPSLKNSIVNAIRALKGATND